MINFSESDINLDLAIRAHSGTSFSPEKRGKQYAAYYMEHMQQVSDEFANYATDENREAIQEDLEAYRLKYLSLLNNMLHAKSRCISSMITGPSNFPVNRAQKYSTWADKHTNRWLEFQDWKLQRLRRMYNPKLASHVIRSDDVDAIEKLEKKLAKLKANHELMKLVNKVIKRKGLTNEQRIDELVNGVGISEDLAHKLLTPNYMGQVGVEPFYLTNNLANIKRLEGRLIELQREQAREQPDEYNAPAGIVVVENTNEARIQLIFDGKPAPEIRTILKRNGFRWSPTQGAWQRMLNANGRYAAKQVIGMIKGGAA